MLWAALLLGLVEGLTEFLPVSSTGHLILTATLLDLHGKRAEVFEIFIQLGAILAVVWEYRGRLLAVARNLGRSRLPLSLALGFLPAATTGLVLHDWISSRLFTPVAVALALLAGAAAIFVVEALPRAERTRAPEDVDWRQALGVGCAQCLALWPGFSRSAATILGGMSCGLTRHAATEFSFLLAVPTLGAASLYDLAKNAGHLVAGDVTWLALAFVVSFLVAWATVRWLLRFVSTHTLRAFAWYRILLGAIVLLAAR